MFSPLLGAPFQPEEIFTLATVDNTERNPITCSLCNSIIRQVFGAIADGATNEDVIALVISVCESLNLYNAEVCGGTAALAMVFDYSTFLFRVK